MWKFIVQNLYTTILFTAAHLSIYFIVSLHIFVMDFAAL